GNTVAEIEAAGLAICARIRVDYSGADGVTMARAIAAQLDGMAQTFRTAAPDLVLVLGDRGEMLAGALAAIQQNIVVAHVHGGERSGTVDEPVRHAISKLAHYHFAATEQARERLIHMGERPDSIFVTGAPGLDGLRELATEDRKTLATRAGLDASKPIA